MIMEPSLKDADCKSNERKRKLDPTGRRERDLRRWQRKRETIEKFEEKKFGVPKTDRGFELRVHNLRR
jgi:hypothetical protein